MQEQLSVGRVVVPAQSDGNNNISQSLYNIIRYYTVENNISSEIEVPLSDYYLHIHIVHGEYGMLKLFENANILWCHTPRFCGAFWVWNHLPNNIRCAENLISFKKLLRTREDYTNFK